MTDNELPGASTQDVVDTRTVSSYVRDVPRSTIRIPSESLSILKTEAEKFRRSAERALDDLEHQRRTVTRHVRTDLLALAGQAIYIAGIAAHQGDLIEAIIARIPAELLSDVSIYLD